MNKELKPCPFCGGKGELWNNKLTHRLYGAICEECDCMTPHFTTREEAIEAWNRRKPLEDIVEQLEHYAKESHIIYIREDEECCRGWFEALEFAIEIVKSGGKV